MFNIDISIVLKDFVNKNMKNISYSLNPRQILTSKCIIMCECMHDNLANSREYLSIIHYKMGNEDFSYIYSAPQNKLVSIGDF